MVKHHFFVDALEYAWGTYLEELAVRLGCEPEEQEIRERLSGLPDSELAMHTGSSEFIAHLSAVQVYALDKEDADHLWNLLRDRREVRGL